MQSEKRDILTKEAQDNLANAERAEEIVNIDRKELKKESKKNDDKKEDKLSDYLNIAQNLLTSPNITQEMLINSLQPYSMLGPMRMTPYLPEQLEEAEQLINILKILEYNLNNP